MKLAIIVAASENNVIGKNNKMVWNLPEDTRFFKNTTWGFPLIMGRKTYEALGGKPLPGRFNIVITRQQDFKAGNQGVQVATTLSEAIRLAEQTDSKMAFIGGGGQLYAESIMQCDIIYITRVKATLDGDAFFPEIPLDKFQLSHSKLVPADEKHAYTMDFQSWTKKSSLPD